MIRRGWMIAAGVAALVAVPLWAGSDSPQSGPAKGGQAPLLHVDAFNDNQGNYCVTCRAGQNPLIVSFISKNDEATRALINAVDAARRANQNTMLCSAIVVVAGADAERLKKYISDKHLSVPAAVAALNQGDMPSWKINPKVSTTTVLVRHHAIQASLVNLPAKDVRAKIKDLLK